ncbi:MAG: glycosyltransferase [Candidatus Babeliales bacterium]
MKYLVRSLMVSIVGWSALAAASEQTQFAIVIASYNNKQWYTRNLDSVLSQAYPADKYRVIYVDDASSDGTADLVEAYCKQHAFQDRITLIRNSQRRLACENYYRAIHSCDPREVVLIVDGDDWLAHTNVLTRLDQEYQNSDVWMTYGNARSTPYRPNYTAHQIAQEVIFKNELRRCYTTQFTHLRTFYAGLFQKIKLEDLIYTDGKFLPTTCDVAFMTPLFEMAGMHMRHINEVLYIYNLHNPINDEKVHLDLQKQVEEYVRSSRPYQTLASLPMNSEKKPSIALAIFSYNDAFAVEQFLCQAQERMQGIDAIHVFYSDDTGLFDKEYEKLQILFPALYCTSMRGESGKSLSNKLQGYDYLVCLFDTHALTDSVDVRRAVQSLQKSGADGYYLSMGSHGGIEHPLDDQVVAWRFSQKEDERLRNQYMVIYGQKRACELLAQCNFSSPEALRKSLCALSWDAKKVGISGNKSVARKMSDDSLEDYTITLRQARSYRHSDRQKSVELYEKASALRADELEPLVELGEYYCEKNNNQQSYEYMKQAYAAYRQRGIWDEHMDYRINNILGIVSWYNSDFQTGEDALQRCLDMHPDYIHLINNFNFYIDRWGAERVYVTPGYNGRLFDICHPEINSDGSKEPYYAVREACKQYGVQLIQANDLSLVDGSRKMVAFDLPFDDWAVLSKFNDDNRILFLWEPPSTRWNNYDPEYHEPFAKIYTWDDTLVDNKKYFKFFYPVCRPMINDVVDFDAKKLATMVSCDKYSAHPDELYSARKRVIKWYESMGQQNHFDLYGVGWEKYRLDCGKGSVVSKLDTIKNYKFCYCYENIKGLQGYVTEKIFNCFTAGCVPIYWGAENIETYVPKKCFIDRRDFADEKAVFEHISAMSRDRYEQYIAAIRAYLETEQAQQFAVNNFIHIFQDAIGIVGE